jgi:hypothetical protein
MALFFELLLTRRWALNNKLATPRTENTIRMLCVSFNLIYCHLTTVKSHDFEICFLVADVACSVVAASQDGHSTHYLAEWLVKIDQIRKTYNSDMELETSPPVLTSNCIILNYNVPNVSNDTIAAMLLIPEGAAQRFEYCRIPI